VVTGEHQRFRYLLYPEPLLPSGIFFKEDAFHDSGKNEMNCGTAIRAGKRCH
jgi:hypothetical protein